MKFSCEKCGTRYTIADEKVRRKILKIRCKVCEHIILVRDPEASAPAGTDSGRSHGSEAAGLAGAGGDRTALADPLGPLAEVEWYAAPGGEQLGPFPFERLRDLIATHRLSADDVVWNERMPDWAAAGQVPGLSEYFAPARPVAPPAPPAPRGRPAGVEAATIRRDRPGTGALPSHLTGLSTPAGGPTPAPAPDELSSLMSRELGHSPTPGPTLANASSVAGGPREPSVGAAVLKPSRGAASPGPASRGARIFDAASIAPPIPSVADLSRAGEGPTGPRGAAQRLAADVDEHADTVAAPAVAPSGKASARVSTASSPSIGDSPRPGWSGAEPTAAEMSPFALAATPSPLAQREPTPAPDRSSARPPAPVALVGAASPPPHPFPADATAAEPATPAPKSVAADIAKVTGPKPAGPKPAGPSPKSAAAGIPEIEFDHPQEFFGDAAASVPMPSAPASTASPGKTSGGGRRALLALGGVLLLAGGIGLGIWVARPGTPSPAPAVVAKAVDAGPIAATVAPAADASPPPAREDAIIVDTADAGIGPDAAIKAPATGPVIRSARPTRAQRRDNKAPEVAAAAPEAPRPPPARTSAFAALGKSESNVELGASGRTRTADLPETLSGGEISTFIRRYQASIKGCYERQLKRDDSMRGARATLRFTIQPAGRTSNVKLEDRFNGTVLKSCLEGVVKRWRFPAFRGEAIPVEYPLIFQAT